MSKHAEVEYDKYFHIHSTSLQKLKDDGLVLFENLEQQEQGACRLVMNGDVDCRGGLNLRVRKTFATRISGKKKYIKTIKYSYHLRTKEDHPIFRYDNAHRHARMKHNSKFHIHRYKSGIEVYNSPFEVIDLEQWPTLAEVIQEANQYYLENLILH